MNTLKKNLKEFNVYKFRSMRIDAPKNMATSLLTDPGQYHTKVGKFIRKLSLDELPQFWNVFIGTMSFIGYRPLVLTEEKCNEMRNKLIADGKHTDALDEVLLKVIHSKQKKLKVVYREA